ncbi:MAG: putative dehydrogenase [Planctomycetota bacterium]|jgi:predicted dehydrogenase
MTIDYTKTSISFRVRKVLRYLKLHGASRTLVKIRGQYHMAREYEQLPAMQTRKATGKHVALIGCGNFAFSNIAFYLKKKHGHCIRACMDTSLERAASLYEQYGLDYYTSDADEIMADPEIDLVYVASNHATHAEYAIAAIEAGKAVHIEKPHVASRAQLDRLRAAAERQPARIRIGFNRPHSSMGREVAKAMASQTGPSMMNWFVVGHPIDADHWYHRKGEGGRILGNLCHWTDFVLRMVDRGDRYPIRITPTRASKSDCDMAVTYCFGDETIATITFTAKGHSFSGVRERFAAQRGDVLISLDDFRTMTIEHNEHRIKRSPWFNDQGHADSILASYRMSKKGGDEAGETLEYICDTAELFLATKDALESGQSITLSRELSAVAS